MLREILPQFEDLDQSADYALWLHYADHAEWIGEPERPCDLNALPRLFTHLEHHGTKKPLQLGKCRKCEYSENGVE